MIIESSPVRSLRGTLRVPGDKSISHRALTLGAVARGDTEILGFLESADCLATMEALRALGVVFERADGCLRVRGAGLHGLRPAPHPLDLGNSGTALRLLAGLLAGQRFASVLTGDASLRRRPMQRIVEPLRAIGAEVAAAPGGTPPLTIGAAAGPLRCARHKLSVASAQVKSCLLLAGLYAEGESVVIEPAQSRDHTERMLETFGCSPALRAGGRIAITGGVEPRAARVEVPADLSSAMFFVVAASIVAEADVTLPGVGVNPTRTGGLAILRAMGADLEIGAERTAGGEPVADIRVRAARLRGVDVAPRLVASAIDEFPALFVAAACAAGTTRVSGAAELRVKESDRIEAMARGLRACGITVATTADGMVIEGGRPRGATVDSFGDHRVAMAFAVAGAAATDAVRVRDCANVGTSFPGFVADANRIGLRLAVPGA